jgi:hypothetical protein
VDPTRPTLRATFRTLLAAAVFALAGMPLADTLHQLEHLREDRAPAEQPKQSQGQAKPICLVCAAFTAAGHALTSALHLPLASHDVEATVPGLSFGWVPRLVQPYLQRAPPAFLVSA